MHELSHTIVVIAIGGRARDFNLLPSIENGRVIFGSVTLLHQRGGLLFIPLLAPMLLWVAFYYYLSFRGYAYFDKYGMLDLSFAFKEKSIEGFLFDLYFGLQLLNGGAPSIEDLRGALRSIVGFDGVVIAAIVLLLVHAL